MIIYFFPVFYVIISSMYQRQLVSVMLLCIWWYLFDIWWTLQRFFKEICQTYGSLEIESGIPAHFESGNWKWNWKWKLKLEFSHIFLRLWFFRLFFQLEKIWKHQLITIQGSFRMTGSMISWYSLGGVRECEAREGRENWMQGLRGFREFREEIRW